VPPAVHTASRRGSRAERIGLSASSAFQCEKSGTTERNEPSLRRGVIGWEWNRIAKSGFAPSPGTVEPPSELKDNNTSFPIAEAQL
jgi:hypothetical protein